MPFALTQHDAGETGEGGQTWGGVLAPDLGLPSAVAGQREWIRVFAGAFEGLAAGNRNSGLRLHFLDRTFLIEYYIPPLFLPLGIHTQNNRS